MQPIHCMAAAKLAFGLACIYLVQGLRCICKLSLCNSSLPEAPATFQLQHRDAPGLLDSFSMQKSFCDMAQQAQMCIATQIWSRDMAYVPADDSCIRCWTLERQAKGCREQEQRALASEHTRLAERQHETDSLQRRLTHERRQHTSERRQGICSFALAR